VDAPTDLQSSEKASRNRGKTMDIPALQNLVRYISNSQGEKTEVIIPIELWVSLVNALPPIEIHTHSSGLDPIDGNEPKAQIIADLQESIRAVSRGETYPISHLWDDLDNRPHRLRGRSHARLKTGSEIPLM
jgi:hypothetical protein